MRHRSYHRTGSPKGVGWVGGEGEKERKRWRGMRGEGEAVTYVGDGRVVLGAWEESEVRRAEANTSHTLQCKQ